MADIDGSRGLFGKLADSLENRLVLLASAALLGVGTNLAIIKTDPDVRADAHTATMDRQARKDDMAAVGQMIAGVETGLREYVELRNRRYDAHLEKAEKGWDLIYQMRSDLAGIKQEMQSVRSSIDDIKRWPNGYPPQ